MTVRVASPVISSKVAVISVDPRAIPVASPVSSMVATAVLELSQVAVVVILVVLPSEYVPSALNCRLWPAGIEALSGVSSIDTGGPGGDGVGLGVAVGVAVGVSVGLGLGVGVAIGVPVGVGVGAVTSM